MVFVYFQEFKPRDRLSSCLVACPTWRTTLILGLLAVYTLTCSSALASNHSINSPLKSPSSHYSHEDRSVVKDIQNGVRDFGKRLFIVDARGHQNYFRINQLSQNGLNFTTGNDSAPHFHTMHSVKHERSRRQAPGKPPKGGPGGNGKRPPPNNNSNQQPKPPPQENNDDCVHKELHDTEGQIQWKEKSSYVCSSKWFITVPEDQGITLTFHHVKMENELRLKVHELNNQTMKPIKPSLWTFAEPNGNNFMAPLLVRRNQVLIEVMQQSTVSYDRKVPGSNTVSESSSFNLSYTAHPMRSMPSEIDFDEGDDAFRTSSVMYNCSEFPKEIPQALQCDMIQQCVNAEDEEDCLYKSPGCGDWVPYGNHCLKAFFKPFPDLTQNRSHITMPINAEDVCMAKFQATLALLPDEHGIQLAAEIIQNSGYHSASVGLRKMRPRSFRLKQFYRYIWQWGKRGSPVAYEQVEMQRNNPVTDCAVFDLTVDLYLQPSHCLSVPSKDSVPEVFVCMKPNHLKTPQKHHKKITTLHLTSDKKRERPLGFPTKLCPDGSLVQTFHTCEWRYGPVMQTWHSSVFPSFQCMLGHSIHYSFVCDGVDDCADGSDEFNCMAPRLPSLMRKTFVCGNSLIVPALTQCNGFNDCFDNSDEEDCIKCKRDRLMCPSLGCIPKQYGDFFEACEVPKRAITPRKLLGMVSIELDGFGMSDLKPAGKKGCKDGYFQCDDHFCIPSFLLNNGEKDCPNGIDEAIPAENITCPGFYRCHTSGSCIHNKFVCDDVPHCPEKDDERYCHLSCPQNCTCEGYAFTCQTMFDPLLHLNTRYLDISGVNQPALQNISSMEYLFFLNLSHCQMEEVNLTNMPQLQCLDLSFNLLRNLSYVSLSELKGLKYLSLSNNPLVETIDSAFTCFIKTSGIKHIKELLLVNVGINSIEDNSFAPFSELTSLDLRQNDIKDFDKNVFSGLSSLTTLQADNYKLCCSYFHNAEAIPECQAPEDELSSCDDLLTNGFYQISVWILAAFNIPANAAALVYRMWEVTKRKSKSYTILVANLCLSDLLMGIYLIFIGSADVHYRSIWVSKETEWTSSDLCTAAGILAFLSSEVSAFVVCLITLERFLVMCFPLRSKFHLTSRSAWLACAPAWVLGLLLATIPLMAGWDLYGRNGFCLPLPITRTQYPGHQYIFAVFIYVNFVLFILIGLGQVCIYKAMKSVGLSSSLCNKQRDLAVARRLMLVIATDFLCWFPIGLMGVLSALGTPIPGEVNVLAALFILPFNSSLNPHLYTLNSLLDQYQEKRMERRIQKTIYRIHTEIAKWPADKVESLVKSCLQSQVIQNKKVMQWMKLDHSPRVHEEIELELSKGCEEDSRSDTQLTSVSHTESDLCD